MKDLYDFGWAWEAEEEVTEEVTTTEGDEVNQEATADASTTESDEIQSEDETSNEELSGTEWETDDNQSNTTWEETETTQTADELEAELKELEALLNEDVNSDNTDDNDTEVSNKLKEAVDKMKSLSNKIDKLELEKAELTKFWENANLSPELIIIKANYSKAMKWDEAAKNKIKELIANDLWLEVTDQKQVFVSNSISWGTDINTDNWNEWEWYWFVM